MLSPEQMVNEVKGLPITPQILPRLQKLLRDPNSDLQDIVNLVRLEASVAAQIIRLSNSAVYAGAQRCSTVEEAFNRVGFREAEKLVSLAVMSAIVDRPLNSYQLTGPVLWTRSIATALAAERLATLNRIDVRLAYSLGLLSQVGLLVVNLHSANRPFAFRWEGYPLEYRRSEEAAFGFSSHQVGAALLRKWGFPEEIWEALAAQDQLHECFGPKRRLALILYTARFIRTVLCDGGGPSPEAKIMGELDLNEDFLLGMAGELRGELHNAKKIL